MQSLTYSRTSYKSKLGLVGAQSTRSSSALSRPEPQEDTDGSPEPRPHRFIGLGGGRGTSGTRVL